MHSAFHKIYPTHYSSPNSNMTRTLLLCSTTVLWLQSIAASPTSSLPKRDDKLTFYDEVDFKNQYGFLPMYTFGAFPGVSGTGRLKIGSRVDGVR